MARRRSASSPTGLPSERFAGERGLVVLAVRLVERRLRLLPRQPPRAQLLLGPPAAVARGPHASRELPGERLVVDVAVARPPARSPPAPPPAGRRGRRASSRSRRPTAFAPRASGPRRAAHAPVRGPPRPTPAGVHRSRLPRRTSSSSERLGLDPHPGPAVEAERDRSAARSRWPSSSGASCSIVSLAMGRGYLLDRGPASGSRLLFARMVARAARPRRRCAPPRRLRRQGRRVRRHGHTAATVDDDRRPPPRPRAGRSTGHRPSPPSREPRATAIALLTDVRAARHPGFDRVVFEFRNGVPGYDVRYVAAACARRRLGRRGRGRGRRGARRADGAGARRRSHAGIGAAHLHRADALLARARTPSSSSSASAASRPSSPGRSE